MKNIIVILFVLTTSCCLEQSRESCSLSIMSWNVQNLFDGEDNGSEYSDFSVAKGFWSDALYNKRLKNISKVVTLNNPDIVALQEIEGQSILQDLQSDYLSEYLYIVAGVDSGAVTTGYLSKYPITRVGIITPDTSEWGVRNMLEICVDIDGRDLILINNHWKSKRGDFSEHLRLASSRVLKKRVLELIDSEVILLGDFNENYNEIQRIDFTYETALLFNETGEGLTILDDEPDTGSEFFTPWPDSLDEGSYRYNGEWESIDNFLLNQKLMDEENFFFSDFYVDKRELLFDRSGNIKKWITDYGTGYSDHLPIMLILDCDGIETTLE